MRGIVLTLVALLVVAACPASAQEFLRYGLLVPAGTPQPIIARLNKELQALASSPEVQERINNEAGSAMTSTSAEYAAEIVREDALWGPLIRSLNIKVE